MDYHKKDNAVSTVTCNAINRREDKLVVTSAIRINHHIYYVPVFSIEPRVRSHGAGI